MGKLDTEIFRDLNPEDFRVLTAVEMGMKNHELVPATLCVLIAHLKKGGCGKIIEALCQRRLLAYEVKERLVAGYRLTNSGYDFLALRALITRGSIRGFGNKIGVGKESDVYVVQADDGEDVCLKLHRLGRTSFRQLKNKRDYHKNRSSVNWLYLSRLSASREMCFMRCLHAEGFSVPKPLDSSRHAVLMQLIDGVPLCQVKEVDDVGGLYDQCMAMITDLASCGLIHGDFNEFNLIVADEEEEDEEEEEEEDDDEEEEEDDESKKKTKKEASPMTGNKDAQKEADGKKEDDNKEKEQDEEEDEEEEEEEEEEDGGGCKVYMIDFPQMVSTSHSNAKYYFDRDVECIKNFFYKRFHYHLAHTPQLQDVVKTKDLDIQLKASGYVRKAKNGGEEEEEEEDEEEEEEEEEKDFCDAEDNLYKELSKEDTKNKTNKTKNKKEKSHKNNNKEEEEEDDDGEEEGEEAEEEEEEDGEDGIVYVKDLENKSSNRKTAGKKAVRREYTQAEVRRMQARNVQRINNIQIRKRTQKEGRKALKHKLNKDNPHLAKLQPVWDY